MATPIESWQVRELEGRVLGNVKGKRRKGFSGELQKCELVELLQYNCEVDRPVTRASRTRCWPIERLFRRCQDREGAFMVETTAWEREERNR